MEFPVRVGIESMFSLNHEPLRKEPSGEDYADVLARLGPIESPESFNRYCRTACRFWPGQSLCSSPRFAELDARIARGGNDIIATAWGGVVITLHEHPRVEKILVVRRGGYLALEKHELKDEHLEVKEGRGLILWRAAPGQPLLVQSVAGGDRFHLSPGMEHCLIGTEDLLVFEQSTDPKGMDQDLMFIYTPEVAPQES